MGFDELIQAIGEQACRQRETILAKAEEDARTILREAAARRDATLREAHSSGEPAARRESSRILSQARLQARREVQAARYEVIEATLRSIERRLAHLLQTEAYPGILGRLLDECLTDTDLPVTVICRPEDRAAVEEQALRLAREVTVKEQGDFPCGGLHAVFGEQGRVVCRNGLLDRMERIRPLLLQEAARLLFDPTGKGKPS